MIRSWRRPNRLELSVVRMVWTSISRIQAAMADTSLRIVHLNSLLTGGGTDDQCVKLVRGLCQLEQRATLLGPDDRDYSRVAREQQIPFQPTPPEGLLKL